MKDFFNLAFDDCRNMILKSNSLEEAKESIWKCFMSQPVIQNSLVRIALLNAPCYGFGDVIFCKKIFEYLKDWYGIEADIFTTLPEAHINLGTSAKHIIGSENTEDKNDRQCQTFTALEFPYQKTKIRYHLFFVCPLVTDFSPDRSDVINTFEHAKNTNVFFFSEYNSSQTGIDFPTGVGWGKLGLLMTNPVKRKRLESLKNPYSVIYIAGPQHVADARKCYRNFLMMLSRKYKKRRLDVVVPQWIAADARKRFSSKNITLRDDIFPLNNNDMLSLFQFSEKDILVTGDQSITDVMSCCDDKNIFYQIADWKQDFAKNLSKFMPNKFLSSRRTSCGSLQGVKYVSNYINFKKTWDFRKLGRPKMDAVVSMAHAVLVNGNFRMLSDWFDNRFVTLSFMKNAMKTGDLSSIKRFPQKGRDISFNEEILWASVVFWGTLFRLFWG
jgi:hypothetical protein